MTLDVYFMLFQTLMTPHELFSDFMTCSAYEAGMVELERSLWVNIHKFSW